MTSDRERWDKKHAAFADAPPSPPDPFFERALERVVPSAGSRAVDIACGRGRHTLPLLRHGFEVSAWDVSPVALELVRSRAARTGHAPKLATVDLVRGDPFPAVGFDLAVVVSFLDRGLYARLKELVRLGGHLILTTWTTDRQGTRPSDEYCLRPGELAEGIDGFETLLYAEEQGRAGCLARRR